MTIIKQFILYNLLPSLAAGVLTWLVVYAAITWLRIEHAPHRLPLLYAPVVKSVLILLGVGSVLPWPRAIFMAWHVKMLSFDRVLPYLLLWAGLVLLARFIFVQRAQRLALQNTEPAEQVAPRLAHSMSGVLAAYRNCPHPMQRTKGMICYINHDLRQPQLLVSNRKLTSPLVLTSADRPVIVFPAELVTQLDDDELEGALGHELAHFMLRNPAWCAPINVRHLTSVSPIAGLLATQLQHEEEKACDDMAINALGKPEAYAAMLLKSYRFAAERSNHLGDRLRVLPQLLGGKSRLTERVERLLQAGMPLSNQRWQALVTCLLWGGIWYLFFAVA